MSKSSSRMESEETLHRLLQKTVTRHPNKVAVIEDNGSSRCELIYQELWDISGTVAETLSSFDLKSSISSQFIAVCMDQCLVYPAILTGILRQGFAFACLDPEWTNEKEIDYLKKLGSAILIHTCEERRSAAKDNCCRIEVKGLSLYFQRLNFPSPSRECLHFMAYSVLTSGTTGQPKLVRVPHTSIVPNILSLGTLLDITCEDTVFLSSPSTFDPSVVDIFMAFAAGASLLITEKSIKASATSLLHILFPDKESQGVSILQMTPSLFNRWSDKELQNIVLGPKTSLRVLILGGEPFPSTSRLKMCQGIGNATRMYNIYGMTEVSAWASIHEVTLATSNLASTHTYHNENPVPLGQPLLETLFQVRDCLSNSLIEAGCGEMFIGSSTRLCEIDDEICMDYSPPIFRATGDIVQIHANGNICYVGRKDHIIKRWGHRVNLENIEHVATSHPGVKSAISVWDEANHKLSLVVALEGFLPTVALRQYFLQCVRSDTALIPDEILQVESLALNQHGKISRQTASELLKTKMTPPCKTFTCEIFFEICKEVLGLESVEPGSFLQFGGNSLLAVMLITQLETIVGCVPKNLPSLLLSGESLQSICEILCKFYDGDIQSEMAENLPSVDPVHNETLKMASPIHQHQFPLKKIQDKLISYSLRGKSSCGGLLCCIMNQAAPNNLTLSLSWKVDLGKCIDASPLCLVYESGSTGIVIGSHSGTFMLLESTTGKPRWSLNLPHRIESSACPSSCGKYVYVGCYDGALYCINTFSGKVKWRYCTGGMIKCTPALCNENGSIIFGSYDSKVYCVNAKSGQLEWSNSWSNNGSWIASPVVVEGVAILCSLACMAYGVTSLNGNIIWTITFKQPIFSSPCHFSLVSEVFVIIAEVQGNVHCIKASTGEEVAVWQAPGHIFAPLTVFLHSSSSMKDHHHKILVACYDQYLYCLVFNHFNHKLSLEWKSHLQASIGSVPFPFVIKTPDEDENVCASVINSTGKVFLISVQDGTVCCSYSVNSEVFSSPVLYEDQLYFGCRDNNLYSLKIKC